ncbi:MAG TPA: hypothetical protein VL463_11425 [Kofleriaceae bacterium]|nr:hypothetical protein [Kofleriaceae bacterium]
MKLWPAALLLCASVARADDTIKIQPNAEARCTDAPEVKIAIEVVSRGAWLGSSTGARCFVAKGNDTALDAELGNVMASMTPDCSRSVELGAVAGVSYQDVVTVMDAAVKAGFVNIGISDPKSLSIQFTDTVAKEKANAHCTVKPVSTPSAGTKPAASTATKGIPSAPAPATKPDLAKAPVVIITTAEVTLDGKSLGTVKSLAKGKGTIAPLVTALKAITDKGPLVLQADKTTDAAVINRVILSGKAAGFDNVLFAIKTK